jgi:hypothetical protein
MVVFENKGLKYQLWLVYEVLQQKHHNQYDSF